MIAPSIVLQLVGRKESDTKCRHIFGLLLILAIVCKWGDNKVPSCRHVSLLLSGVPLPQQ